MYLKRFGTAEKFKRIIFPYIHRTNNLSYNIYNHRNKGLGNNST